MDWAIFPFALYVAFAFSVLLFGGLAYRQIHDIIDLRRSGSGEDIAFFWAARATLLVAGGAVMLIPTGIVCYQNGTPSIFRYALPMILFAQLLQIAVRLSYQRLRLRTTSIVISHLFRSGFVVIPYDQVFGIKVHRRLLWTRITILFDEHQAQTFRIFRVSEGALLHRIGTMTGLPHHTQLSS